MLCIILIGRDTGARPLRFWPILRNRKMAESILRRKLAEPVHKAHEKHGAMRNRIIDSSMAAPHMMAARIHKHKHRHNKESESSADLPQQWTREFGICLPANFRHDGTLGFLTLLHSDRAAKVGDC
jgi:hypothetical protein